jgi:competence protein CoiA
MLTAYDKNENLINLLETEPKNLAGSYFCPACHGEVRLKNGQIKRVHFAHKSLQDCNSWSENESKQHLGLKAELYNWFKSTEKVEIERFLPELNQTPDLLVNEKIAIEIQCSHLSLKRLRERTENYRTHGYTVLWLMGYDLWLRKNLTELQKNLMYFSENRGFYFWELDLEERKLRLKSLLHQNLRGQIVHLTEEIPFGQGNLLAQLRRPFLSQDLKKLDVTVDKGLLRFVQQQLFHSTPKWMKIQQNYYCAGKNLLNEDFTKPYFAPPGLNLLADKPVSTSDSEKLECSPNFIQISQGVSEYYQNFYENFQKKPLKSLYPPRFYAIMKDKMTRE